jgi:hypothetical protein
MRNAMPVLASTLVSGAALAAPVLAGARTLQTCRYYAQENCISADSFSESDIAAIGLYSGCATQISNGPVAGASNVVTNARLTGQFSLDMKTFVAGKAGISQPALRTPVGGPGYRLQRICSTVLEAARIGRRSDDE